MTFERPQALLFLLLAVPLILLHLRWRKRRRALVSSLAPWRGLAPSGTARRGMRRLEEALALGFLLMALIGIVGAWSRPVLGPPPSAPTRLAIVIDGSATMNASMEAALEPTPERSAKSRFDVAREAAIAAIDSRSDADEVVVWVVGLAPVVVVDPTRDLAAAKRALAASRPTLAPRALAAAVRGAETALAGQGALLVLTDAPGAASLAALPAATVPRAIGVVDLRPTTRNDRVVGVRVDPENPLRLEVRLRGDRRVPSQRVVRLFRDGTVVAQASVTLSPEKESIAVLPLGEFDARGGLGEVVLDAAPTDAFREDDAARIYFTPPKKLRLALVARGLAASPFIADALRAMPSHVDFAAAKLAQPDAGAATFADVDVVICDGDPPERLASDRAVLVFGAAGRGAAPPRVWTTRAHPILDGIDLSPLRLDAANVLDVRPSETVLIDSDVGPIAVCGERAGARSVRFGFRPEATSLPLEPAFPVLLRNALVWLARGPLLPPVLGALEPIRTLEPLPPAVTRVLVDGPGGVADGALGVPYAVRNGDVIGSVPLPPPGGPYLLTLHGAGVDHVSVVQWTAPTDFDLDGPSGQTFEGADAAVLALPKRLNAEDHRVHLSRLFAVFGALALVLGAWFLRVAAAPR